MQWLKKVGQRYRLIVADFKTVKKIFTSQGVKPELVDQYLDIFKELRDKNKIPANEKNIDVWGKKNFSEFQERLDALKKEKTKTEVKKGEIDFDRHYPGTDKVAENDKWAVYEIKTNAGSAALAKGTEWCIKHDPSENWEFYDLGNTIYFAIAKDDSVEKKWSKVCILCDFNGELTYWDANDKPYSEREIDVSDLGWPSVTFEAPDPDKYIDKCVDLIQEEIDNFADETPSGNNDDIWAEYRRLTPDQVCERMESQSSKKDMMFFKALTQDVLETETTIFYSLFGSPAVTYAEGDEALSKKNRIVELEGESDKIEYANPQTLLLLEYAPSTVLKQVKSNFPDHEIKKTGFFIKNYFRCIYADSKELAQAKNKLLTETCQELKRTLAKEGATEIVGPEHEPTSAEDDYKWSIYYRTKDDTLKFLFGIKLDYEDVIQEIYDALEA